jgi:hypothetical protein
MWSHAASATDNAGVVGAPDSDPARFIKISIHAGSESVAPGQCPDAPRTWEWIVALTVAAFSDVVSAFL